MVGESHGAWKNSRRRTHPFVNVPAVSDGEQVKPAGTHIKIVEHPPIAHAQFAFAATNEADAWKGVEPPA